MSGKPSIILIKKKVMHGGHHGGAWKVAYADFVTAMMALFIVLWLTNTSKKVQLAVSGYFKDPSAVLSKVPGNLQGTNEKVSVIQTSMTQLKSDLQKAISKVPNFDKLQSHIEMTITPEGLRVELLEAADGTFFDSGSSQPNSDGKDILIALSNQVGKLPNQLIIEGHTDSKPYARAGVYGNWELSTDRANAVRKLMQQNGVREKQVKQVRGYSDQMLRKPSAPFDPSNRRVVLIVLNQEKTPTEGDSNPAGTNDNPHLDGQSAKPQQGKH